LSCRNSKYLVIFWYQEKKFSDKKNVFLKNNQLKQYGTGYAGFVQCISRQFIALGMHITINEQGVIREC